MTASSYIPRSAMWWCLKDERTLTVATASKASSIPAFCPKVERRKKRMMLDIKTSTKPREVAMMIQPEWS